MSDLSIDDILSILTVSDSGGGRKLKATTDSSDNSGILTNSDSSGGRTVKVELNGGASLGDVVGPSSSTDNAIVRFDSTTGKLIQNSGLLLDDNSNITFPKEIAHTISIAASTTAATAGASLTITSGNGNGAASGIIRIQTPNETSTDATGSAFIATGNTQTANSGSVDIRSGNTTDGDSGNAVIASGSCSSSGNAGNVLLFGGSSNNGAGSSIIITSGISYNGAGGVISLTPGAGTTTNGYVNLSSPVFTPPISSAIDSTAIMTLNELLSGYITSTSLAPTTITTPDAGDIYNPLSLPNGAYLDFIIDNTGGASTVTVAAGLDVQIASVITGGTTMTVGTGATGVGMFRMTLNQNLQFILSRIY